MSRTAFVSFSGKDCSGCKHLNERGYCEFTACIIPCTVNAFIPKVKSQTNADRVRAMSDEELSKFLCSIVSPPGIAVNCGTCKAQEFCRMGHNGWFDWLKKEIE